MLTKEECDIEFERLYYLFSEFGKPSNELSKPFSQIDVYLFNDSEGSPVFRLDYDGMECCVPGLVETYHKMNELIIQERRRST